MDKTIEQLFKAFHHLAREIQVYFLSGVLLALNISIIDYFYYQNSLLKFIESHNLLFPVLLIIYISGHFCMAIYFIVFELSKIEEKLLRKLKMGFEKDERALPNIYKIDPETYVHFIERYIIISLMRWTMSAACFIGVIIDSIFLITKGFHLRLLIIDLVFTIGAVSFFLLYAQSEKEYWDRVNSMKT